MPTKAAPPAGKGRAVEKASSPKKKKPLIACMAKTSRPDARPNTGGNGPQKTENPRTSMEASAVPSRESVEIKEMNPLLPEPSTEQAAVESKKPKQAAAANKYAKMSEMATSDFAMPRESVELGRESREFSGAMVEWQKGGPAAEGRESMEAGHEHGRVESEGGAREYSYGDGDRYEWAILFGGTADKCAKLMEMDPMENPYEVLKKNFEDTGMIDCEIDISSDSKVIALLVTYNRFHEYKVVKGDPTDLSQLLGEDNPKIKKQGERMQIAKQNGAAIYRKFDKERPLLDMAEYLGQQDVFTKRAVAPPTVGLGYEGLKEEVDDETAKERCCCRTPSSTHHPEMTNARGVVGIEMGFIPFHAGFDREHLMWYECPSMMQNASLGADEKSSAAAARAMKTGDYYGDFYGDRFFCSGERQQLLMHIMGMVKWQSLASWKGLPIMPFKRRIGDGPEPALHQSDWHGEPCKFGEWAYLPAGKFSSDDDIQASGESDTAATTNFPSANYNKEMKCKCCPMKPLNALKSSPESWVNRKKDLDAMSDELRDREARFQFDIADMECIKGDGEAGNMGVYMIGIMPLHAKTEQEWLEKNWGSFGRICSSDPLGQPIEEIRKYFGAGHGLYFEWLGMYTQSLVYPSVVGGLIWAFQVVQGLASPNDCGMLLVVYAVFLALWATMLMENWKRREAELRFKWGTEDVEEQEQILQTFQGDQKEITREEDDGNIETIVVHKHCIHRFWRFMVTFAVVGFLLVLVLLVSGVALFFKADGAMVELAISGSAGMTGPSETTASGVTESISNTSGVAAELSTSVTITEAQADDPFGNTPSSTYYDLYNYGGSVISVVAIIVLGNIFQSLANWLNELENHRTATEYEDAATMKNFVFNSLNYYAVIMYLAFAKLGTFPGTKIVDNCGLTVMHLDTPSGDVLTIELPDCIQDVYTQLFFVFAMKTFLEQAAEIGIPAFQKYRNNCCKRAKDGGETKFWEKQLNLQHEEDYNVFDEFQEMSIQFGFMTLFAVCMPLAPALAFVNNVIEIRGDAGKLITNFRRTTYRDAEDIGSWFTVLSVYANLAVITNVLLIAFSSTALAEPLVSAGAEPVTIYKSIDERYGSFYLWLCFLGIEHTIFIGKFMIEMFVDDEPARTTIAKERNGWFEQSLRENYFFGRLYDIQGQMEAKIEVDAKA